MKNRIPLIILLLLTTVIPLFGCGEGTAATNPPTTTLFPGPYTGTFPPIPSFTPPTVWPTSAPSPGGFVGLQQPRILSDIDKSLVVRLAVDHPDTKAWFNKSLYDTYVAGSVHWVAVIWNPDGTPNTYRWFWSELGPIPNDINPNSRWYAAVDIGIGIQMITYAIDLEASRVVYTRFYQESLDSPTRFSPSVTPIPKQ